MVESSSCIKLFVDDKLQLLLFVVVFNGVDRVVEVLGRRFGGNGGGSVLRFGSGGFGGGLASNNMFSELYDGRTVDECCCRISRSRGVNGMSGSDVR